MIFNDAFENVDKFIEKKKKTNSTYNPRVTKFFIRDVNGRTEIDTRYFQIAMIKIAYEFACDRIPGFIKCERAKEIAKYLYDICCSKKAKNYSFDDSLIKSSILHDELLNQSKELSSLLKDEDNTHYIIGTSIKSLGTVCYIRIFKVFYSVILLTEEELIRVNEYVIIENDVMSNGFEQLSIHDLLRRKVAGSNFEDSKDYT